MVEGRRRATADTRDSDKLKDEDEDKKTGSRILFEHYNGKKKNKYRQKLPKV